jgi:hypothetical protein
VHKTAWIFIFARKNFYYKIKFKNGPDFKGVLSTATFLTTFFKNLPKIEVKWDFFERPHSGKLGIYIFIRKNFFEKSSKFAQKSDYFTDLSFVTTAAIAWLLIDVFAKLAGATTQ